MLHRPIKRYLFAGAAWLSLSTVPGPVPADTIYETTYIPTTSYVIPTSSVLSTSYIPTTSYVIPTSTVLATDSVLLPTTTTYYRSSILRPRRYVERTSYSLTPTSYLLPTSYVLPTTYVTPTSYVVPTSYLSTSYVVPTSYVSTSYVVPTTYLSSSYITPTRYLIDGEVVTTSATSYPCETTQASPARSSGSQSSNKGNGNGNTITSEPTNGGSSGDRRPSATLNSTPAGEEGMPSNVSPPVPAPVASPPVRPTPPEPAAPPAANLPEKNPADFPLPEPGKAGSPPLPGETAYRKAQRPIYDTRNILRGRVVSVDSNRPEEGVTVILASRTNNFSDRTAMTDADGEFKVSLPDGDWTVKVKMPSGSLMTVGRDYVTASGGKITDPAGRNVGEYVINR